jgi:hypothetical protein
MTVVMEMVGKRMIQVEVSPPVAAMPPFLRKLLLEI